MEEATKVEELICNFEAKIPPDVRLNLSNSLREFVDRQATVGRPVVCVTSGGTTAPLERNMVRFVIYQLEQPLKCSPNQNYGSHYLHSSSM